MSSSALRGALAGAGLLALAFQGTAQITSSGLGEIDSWSLDFAGEESTPLPETLWQGSDIETLIALSEPLDPEMMTPGERMVLSALLKSPANPPEGEDADALQERRAELLFALGEAGAASRILELVDGEAADLSGDMIAADLDLADGRADTACYRISEGPREGAYWAQLRAVCAVIEGDMASAELAVELAAAQGAADDWFTTAIFAASGELPEPPDARFRSGLESALSEAAGLDMPDSLGDATPLYMAARLARRDDIPARLRIDAATRAAEAGLVDGVTHRAAYDALFEMEDAEPRNTLERALAPAAPELATEDAEAASDDPLSLVPDLATLEARRERLAAERSDRQRRRADLLNAALNEAAESPARFNATARLLAEDIAALPVSRASAPYAVTFARAGLATGDGDMLRAWLGNAEHEGLPRPDPFELAFLEAGDIFVGGEASDASLSAITERLVEAAASDRDRQQAAQMLAAWSGLGHDLPAEARGFIAEQETAGRRLGPGAMLALMSAERSGALGEALLRLLEYTAQSPGEIRGADLATLLAILRGAGAEDPARQLALEAAGYTRVLR